MSRSVSVKVQDIPAGSVIFLEDVPEGIVAEGLMNFLARIRKELVIEGKSNVASITLMIGAQYTAFIPPKTKDEPKPLDPAEEWVKAGNPLLPEHKNDRGNYNYPDGTTVSYSHTRQKWRANSPTGSKYVLRDITGEVMYFNSAHIAAEECLRRGFGPVSLLPPEGNDPDPTPVQPPKES